MKQKTRLALSIVGGIAVPIITVAGCLYEPLGLTLVALALGGVLAFAAGNVIYEMLG